MSVRFLVGDCRERLKDLPDESVQCVVTSPSYFGLRDYQTATWDGGDPACDHKPSSTPEQRGIASSTLGGGKNHTGHKLEGFSGSCPRCGAVRVDRQIGLELTPEEYIQTMVAVFREVRRVLRDDGIVWLNIGDSYAGSGKGGNPPESPHQKQATNAGSITVLGRAFRPGSGRADDRAMTRDQRRFLTLHRAHLVERWQWLFQGATLRAQAASAVATISARELAALVDAGLCVPYAAGCAGVRLTEQGRAAA